MKTPDQIMKSFRLHTLNNRSGCIGCAYRDPNKISFKCQHELFKDVLEYIKQLQDGIAQWEDVAASPGAVEDMARENAMLTKYARQREKQVTELSAGNVKLQKEISQLKAERDAAVEDMKEMAQYVADDVCTWCDQKGCKGCAGVPSAPNFKWRGIQKEE